MQRFIYPPVCLQVSSSHTFTQKECWYHESRGCYHHVIPYSVKYGQNIDLLRLLEAHSWMLLTISYSMIDSWIINWNLLVSHHTTHGGLTAIIAGEPPLADFLLDCPSLVSIDQGCTIYDPWAACGPAEALSAARVTYHSTFKKLARLMFQVHIFAIIFYVRQLCWST